MQMWVFKYAPKTFEEAIYNEEIRPKLSKVLNEVPNLLLYGSPGVGKGVFAKLLLEKTKYDYLFINASDHTGIEYIREKVRPFATAMAMTKMKLVIMNEADSLTSGLQGSQKMLRQLMEDTQKICRFIFLCNYEVNIIPELKSRCQVMKIDNPPKKEIGKLCISILKKEGIDYGDGKNIVEIIKKTYPDIRRTLMVLQENSIDGKLSGARMSASEVVYEQVLKNIIEQDFDKVRELIKSNYIDYPSLYEFLYENAGSFKSPGSAVIEIGEHLYRNSTVAISEINFMRMFFVMLQNGIV
jgi:DNA polymerase III delta prime subunit